MKNKSLKEIVANPTYEDLTWWQDITGRQYLPKHFMNLLRQDNDEGLNNDEIK